MSDGLNLTPAQKQMFLLAASKKLGISPNVLKEKLENGEIKSTLEKSGQFQSINKLMNDKGALERLLASEQVKELIKRMKEGK